MKSKSVVKLFELSAPAVQLMTEGAELREKMRFQHQGDKAPRRLVLHVARGRNLKQR